MDAETKEYLDLKLGEILTTLNAGFSRLERLGAQAATRRDRPWERIHR